MTAVGATMLAIVEFTKACCVKRESERTLSAGGTRMLPPAVVVMLPQVLSADREAFPRALLIPWIPLLVAVANDAEDNLEGKVVKFGDCRISGGESPPVATRVGACSVMATALPY